MSEETIPERIIDKNEWGEGPWQTEPDRLQWSQLGRPETYRTLDYVKAETERLAEQLRAAASLQLSRVEDQQ